MLDADEITKRLFIFGVCAIAIVPRQHTDRTRCSIGGGPVSHSFRKLVLLAVSLNMLRFVVKLLPFQGFRLVSDILGVVQILSLTFLCFLTPYLLQTQLATRINLGGRPGADLLQPFYITAALSFSGVFLARTMGPKFWFLNRLGNVVSVPPVLRTLDKYNSVTSLGGHHAGRGNILCQTLYVVEVWHMVTQLLVAIGHFFLDPNLPLSQYGVWDTTLQGFRQIAFSSGWTRIIAHAVFINLLDELVLTSHSTTATMGGEDVYRSRPEPHGDVEGLSLLAPRNR